jgi:hypothetical protein
MSVVGIDHVQVAAPRGCEAEARRFYGTLLGLVEVEKPSHLHARGGVWFRCGEQQLHIGVEDGFAPARKAHPAIRVAVGERDALAFSLLHRLCRKCCGCWGTERSLFNLKVLTFGWYGTPNGSIMSRRSEESSMLAFSVGGAILGERDCSARRDRRDGDELESGVWYGAQELGGGPSLNQAWRQNRAFGSRCPCRSRETQPAFVCERPFRVAWE